jgi:hypothetical protein
LDEFLQPYWNLEQVRSWAETRDPGAVRFAAIPKRGKPKNSSDIEAWCILVATDRAKKGRDVGAELWAASGRVAPLSKFEPSLLMQRFADEHRVPVWEAFFSKDLQVERAHSDELAMLFQCAPESEQALLLELFRAHGEKSDEFRSDPRLGQLSPELRRVAINYLSAPDGSPDVFVREPFPTIRYLEQLFRTGGLRATGNLPGEPKAHEISAADWAGLEIAVGGKRQRLGVWRIGTVGMTGDGDFENVRVEREAVLKAFPAEVAPCLGFDATPETVEQASNEPVRKRSKVMAAADALTQLFPNRRPTLTVSELIRELKTKAPEIGTVSTRTLTRAIALAWPTAAPNRAK